MNREEFIKKLTISAGKKALNFFKKDKSLISLRGQSKGVVTKYDKILDKFIINQIEKFFSKDSILTEESGLIQKRKESLWIVDSLDGSSNFANQNPFFSISIAFFKIKNQFWVRFLLQL